jgi:hypothetical protein
MSADNKQYFSKDVCPGNFLKLTDSYGAIQVPQTSNFLNCTWLINPPQARRVYLMFEYINIPASANKSEKCAENYLSIRSKDRPTRLYKLCGEQRSKKFITNYNDVLINLITDTLNGFSAGFSLVFKAIDNVAAGN